MKKAKNPKSGKQIVREQIEKFAELIREFSIEILVALGLLSRAVNGGFICPICGNGSGEDGTGFEFGVAPDGKNNIGHCFKCGENFDTFKILGLHFGLDPKTQFKELVLKSAELLGLQTAPTQSPGWRDSADAISLSKNRGAKFMKNDAENKNFEEKISPQNENISEEKNSPPPDSGIPPQEGKYTRLVKSARLRLPKFVESQGGKWRGLTLETLEQFRVGFLPHTGKLGLPRVIIPTFTDNHYLGRLVMSEEEKIARKVPECTREKPHFGPKDIFNYEMFREAKDEDTFFVTEGEIDAMSICQLGFKAIAVSGSFVSKLQQRQIDEISARPRIIILFDDDTAGEMNAEKAQSVFRKLGFNAEVAHLKLTTKDAETFELKRLKDANEALQAEPEKLVARLQEILEIKSKTFEETEKQQQFEAEARYATECNLTSKQIFPDCPVDVVIPSGYYVCEQGICKVFKTGIDEPFFGTPIFVSKIYFTPDREESKVELVYLNRRDKTWYKKTCKVSAIKDSKQILKMDEFFIDAPGASRLSTFLIKMMDEEANVGRIKEKKFFTKTGWLQDECEEFVFPTSLDGKYPVIRDGFDFADAFKKNGKFEDSANLLEELIFSTTTSRLTIGAVVAAPLVQMLGLRNIQLHLFAKSGAGKSALIKAAMSIFGNPTKLRQTFGSTQKYLSDLPAKFDGLPVWVDELQSIDRFQRAKLDEFLYNYENGLTRGRLDKNAEEKPRKLFTGVRITSGEQPITSIGSGQGAINRVIELNLKDIMEDKLARKIHKMYSTKTRASYGHFGQKFIDYICDPKNRELLENFYYDTVDNIRLRAAKANGWKPKNKDAEVDAESIPNELVDLIPSHVHMLAGIMTGLHAFENLLFAENSQKLFKAYSCSDRDIDYIIKNFNQIKLTSNGERALEDLVDFVKSEDKGFCHQTENLEWTTPQEVGVAAHGIKFADGTVGMTRSALKLFIKTRLDSSFHLDALIADWSDLDVFEEGNSPTHPHQIFKRYNLRPDAGDSTWLYLIRKNVREHVEEVKKKRLAALAAS